jgi:hypothetical protein
VSADSPLAILQFLSHAGIRSGGAMQALLLARELTKRGHDVTMAFNVAPDDGAAARARLEGTGCRFAAVDLGGRRGREQLRSLLRERAFDVVHVHREIALQALLREERRLPARLGVVANVGTSKPPDAGRARLLNAARIDRIVVVY